MVYGGNWWYIKTIQINLVLATIVSVSYQGRMVKRSNKFDETMPPCGSDKTSRVPWSLYPHIIKLGLNFWVALGMTWYSYYDPYSHSTLQNQFQYFHSEYCSIIVPYCIIWQFTIIPKKKYRTIVGMKFVIILLTGGIPADQLVVINHYNRWDVARSTGAGSCPSTAFHRVWGGYDPDGCPHGWVYQYIPTDVIKNT